ncbi:MAG: SDR family NAD(P)-dependent oxidoreductase [Candidatus Saccharimonadales bacterium]
MNILVTGGAGFIGSRIVAQLLEAGHSVTVFDNLTTGLKSNVPAEANLIEGDIRDAIALQEAVNGQDAVIHLAAQALVTESVADPQKAFDINLGGGQNLLEAMRLAGVKRLVHSSTAAVYGNPFKVPIREDDLKMPINPYGATKYAFEQLLHSYHKSYGLNVVMFRYFNPYGPTENHDPETHAIPNFIKATLAGKPIPLYWNGEQIRDFFYVDDIARAHVMGLAKDGFNIYNLGSGSSIVVRDVVEKIFELAGVTSDINDLGERAGDPTRLMANISKVKSELGWEPQVSLDEGLKMTIDAFRRRA